MFCHGRIFGPDGAGPSNEHNIDRQVLDHRTGSPYNQFGYDNLNRLTGVTYHDSDSEAFGMDDLGNREILSDAIDRINTI